MQLEKLKQSLRKEDSKGNYIRLDSSSSQVLLKDNGHKERNIGLVKLSDNQVIYYKSEDEAQIHRKSKSWSINRCVLDAVDIVEYDTPKAIYRITTAQARHHGLSFKWDNKSFVDKKCFVPIKCWDTEWKDKKAGALIEKFGYEWYSELEEVFAKHYISNLTSVLAKIYSMAEYADRTFPEKQNVFLPFKLTSFMDVKVVMVVPSVFPSSGSNGLAFGFEGNGSLPQVTKMFMKEIESDIYNGCLMLSEDYSMRSYAEQGVLLLNYLPTYHTGPCSAIGWESFMSDVINTLNVKKEHLVFMLYGTAGQVIARDVDKHKHLIISNGMPYTPGYIPGKYFSICNNYLIANGLAPINW